MESHGGLPDPTKLTAGLDPRAKLHRDPFNEVLVFIVSFLGATVIAPTILMIVGAFTGEFNVAIFVIACVGIELLLIFGLLRPQMQPQERLGWALLWGFTAAAMGAAFWELTFIQII